MIKAGKRAHLCRNILLRLTCFTELFWKPVKTMGTNSNLESTEGKIPVIGQVFLFTSAEQDWPDRFLNSRLNQKRASNY